MVCVVCVRGGGEMDDVMRKSVEVVGAKARLGRRRRRRDGAKPFFIEKQKTNLSLLPAAP